MATVSTLAANLERQLSNRGSFLSVATRVLLRTGVNIREPKPQQDGDEAAVSQVRAALAAMGFQT
jgi:hypothetical protein